MFYCANQWAKEEIIKLEEIADNLQARLLRLTPGSNIKDIVLLKYIEQAYYNAFYAHSILKKCVEGLNG